MKAKTDSDNDGIGSISYNNRPIRSLVALYIIMIASINISYLSFSYVFIRRFIDAVFEGHYFPVKETKHRGLM